MKPPTLLQRLVAVQSLIVGLTCSGLVIVSVGAGALLIRRDQDRQLLRLAANLCHGIGEEARGEGLTPVAAAQEFFGESGQADYLFEYVDRGGVVLVASPGTKVAAMADPPELTDRKCATSQASPVSSVAAGARRACRQDCDAGHSVRITAEDALADAQVRRSALILILALPFAVLTGGLLGGNLMRKMLRPLQLLREAAVRHEARSGTELGVHARATELAELERAFDNLLARLGEALDRERRFSQEASHELRTPLTLLRGRFELLAGELQASPRLLAEARAALSDLAALERLVEVLLLLSRSESAPLPNEIVNLSDLAREAVAHQSHVDGPASPQPEVIAPEELLVRGSEELLGRAMENLLENARKFAGPGARVRIRVFQENRWAVFGVEDDGPGVPAALRPHVFERFRRGPAARRGTPGVGLGLAVVRAIAVRHGGQAVAGAAELGGAEFRVSLPLYELSVEGQIPTPLAAS